MFADVNALGAEYASPAAKSCLHCCAVPDVFRNPRGSSESHFRFESAFVLLTARARLRIITALGTLTGSVTEGYMATTPTLKYDFFISYRHGDPDESFARDILEKLEAAGFKGAIDKRDFGANRKFLDEMERCIKESRFTLCVISTRYLESGNTKEEAAICKVLDMSERKERLVPLIIEHVEMPTWLYGITGIDFTEKKPLVDPIEKLKKTLGNP